MSKRIKTLQKLVEACRPSCSAKTNEQLAAAYAAWGALRDEAHALAKGLDQYEGIDSLWNEDEHEAEHSWGDSTAMVSFRTCNGWCDADTVLLNGVWVSVEDNVPYSVSNRWNHDESNKWADEQAQAKADLREQAEAA